MEKKFDFDATALEIKAKEYEKIKIERSQETIIDNMTEVLLKFIDIYPNALKGFVMISISLWQKSSKRTLAAVFEDTPEDRIRVVTEISEVLKRLLTSVLTNSKQLPQLEKAIDAGLRVYEEKWAYRGN